MAVFDAHKNLAISTVAVAPSPPTTGTSLTVPVGEGSRFATPPFNATVCDPSGPPTPLTAEVARVTAIAGDTLTLLRAQEGSTARLILVGDLIAETITAKALTDIESGTNFPLLATTGSISADGDISTGSDLFGREITASQTVHCQDLVAQGTIGAPDANLTNVDANTISALVSVTAPLGQFGNLGTTPLPAANLTGTVADARLSVNVQLKPIPAADLPAHATRHQSGGADPVTVTALAGYPGGTANFLRADGAFAAPPVGGVPSAHHATHETGGSDAVVNLSAAVLTSGTLSDARLSANVALETVANVFTQQPQTLSAAFPAMQWTDTTQPVDQRTFRVLGNNQTLLVQVLTDAGVAVGWPLILSRAGDGYVAQRIFERGRVTPLGEWINVPNTPGNFAVSGGGGGTIAVNTYFNQGYTLIGQTCVYAFYLQLILTGSPSSLHIVIPFVPHAYIGMPFAYGNKTGFMDVVPGAASINLKVDALGVGTTWVAGTYYMMGTIPFEIQ